MTGNGTARGHVIPPFAPRTMATASPAVERVQMDEDAQPEGATRAEKAEIMRGPVVRHPHGTVHALLGAPPGRVFGAAAWGRRHHRTAEHVQFGPPGRPDPAAGPVACPWAW
jgi:hypothetical protein